MKKLHKLEEQQDGGFGTDNGVNKPLIARANFRRSTAGPANSSFNPTPSGGPEQADEEQAMVMPLPLGSLAAQPPSGPLGSQQGSGGGGTPRLSRVPTLSRDFGGSMRMPTLRRQGTSKIAYRPPLLAGSARTVPVTDVHGGAGSAAAANRALEAALAAAVAASSSNPGEPQTGSGAKAAGKSVRRVSGVTRDVSGYGREGSARGGHQYSQFAGEQSEQGRSSPLLRPRTASRAAGEEAQPPPALDTIRPPPLLRARTTSRAMRDEVQPFVSLEVSRPSLLLRAPTESRTAGVELQPSFSLDAAPPTPHERRLPSLEAFGHAAMLLRQASGGDSLDLSASFMTGNGGGVRSARTSGARPLIPAGGGRPPVAGGAAFTTTDRSTGRDTMSPSQTDITALASATSSVGSTAASSDNAEDSAAANGARSSSIFPES
ncbi:hypothetical protein PLESTF_000189700 [Pleodorina starrii]|nr:hypothetical protein PLESTF_000189700 [Pleodorina starrii]